MNDDAKRAITALGYWPPFSDTPMVAERIVRDPEHCTIYLIPIDTEMQQCAPATCRCHHDIEWPEGDTWERFGGKACEECSSGACDHATVLR